MQGPSTLINFAFGSIRFEIMVEVIDFGKAIDVSKLRDKTVLITGGASGLGSGIASRFAEHG